MIALCLVSGSQIFAIDSDDLGDPNADHRPIIGNIGFNGIWKLGQPCAVKIQIPSNLGRPVSAVEITTLDGDAVEVVYRHELNNPTSREVAIPIRIGRRQSVITARLVDSEGNVLVSEDRELTDQEGLFPTQPIILALGSSMGVEELVRSVRLNADHQHPSISVVEIKEPGLLPQSWLEYQAADLLIISTSDSELLSGIDAWQWTAIDNWICRGGGCIVSLDPAKDPFEVLEPLRAWLPGKLQGECQILRPAALESLVSTDMPLSSFPAVLFQAESGRSQLSLNDSQGRTTNWWVTTPYGFGSIQLVASNLDHPSFAQWKHRRLFWQRLIEPYFEKSILDGTQLTNQSNANSYLGYNDLTGQLRSMLEQFPGVSVISFSQIAAMLVALLLLIGPVDYLISVRWLKRPYLSWIFSGGILLSSSIGLAWYYRALRPDQVMVNSAQIVDIDTQTGRADGHIWGHVYSAQARQVSAEAKSNWSGLPIWLDWQGLPGSGLGGLESQMRLERGMPAYEIQYACHEAAGGAHQAPASRLHGFGIPVAGTKSFVGAWFENLPDVVGEGNRSELRELPSVDQLEGLLVNPLKVDLRDVMVFYHQWFYWIKSRMTPGDRVTMSSDDVPRDIARRLNRYKETDGKVSASQWDPAGRDEVDRLLELMMFHQAATGQNYTSLMHRYQPILDHSHLLASDYAILVGRLDSPPSNLKLSFEGMDLTPIHTGIDKTWVRILIKVDASKKLRPK